MRLAGATGINDAGDIVGIAQVTAPDGTQTSVGYELVPISVAVNDERPRGIDRVLIGSG